MRSINLIPLFTCLALALSCFVIAHFQFKEKGFLFNNAYIYATKQERLKLNKTPYYRQSAIVFTFIGVNFILIACNTIIENNLITFTSVGLMILLVVYALASTMLFMIKAK